jgi:hypothetical protein
MRPPLAGNSPDSTASLTPSAFMPRTFVASIGVGTALQLSALALTSRTRQTRLACREKNFPEQREAQSGPLSKVAPAPQGRLTARCDFSQFAFYRQIGPQCVACFGGSGRSCPCVIRAALLLTAWVCARLSQAARKWLNFVPHRRDGGGCGYEGINTQAWGTPTRQQRNAATELRDSLPNA